MRSRRGASRSRGAKWRAALRLSPMPPVTDRHSPDASGADLVGRVQRRPRVDAVRRRSTTSRRGWRVARQRIALGARFRLAAPPPAIRPDVLSGRQLVTHDYLWPYLFRYPGLTVLHDAHLHHARAALLRTRRADDYRAEFAANHPGADRRPGRAGGPASILTSITLADDRPRRRGLAGRRGPRRRRG